MRRTPRALSFDLDDTLWDCDEVIERAERRVYDWLAAHYPRIAAEFDLEAMRGIRKEAAERDPRLTTDLSELRRVTLAWHAQRAEYDPGLAEVGLEVFLAERNRVTLFTDVLPVLQALGRRYPLVALTNGNADLARIGLDHLFTLSLSAVDVGAAKPDPAMFRAVCEALEIRAGDLLHVGDDPVRDVHAARRFGARTVWVNRTASGWPEDLPRAHHEIETFAALHELLEDSGDGA